MREYQTSDCCGADLKLTEEGEAECTECGKLDSEVGEDSEDLGSEQLREEGFSEQDAEMIEKFIRYAEDAKLGDAFAQAKFEKWNQEDREALADIFREQGFEETADAIENPVGKIYMALSSFKEENFE